MPQINIIEKDLTSGGNARYDDFVVAIPCVCNSLDNTEPVLIKKDDDFDSVVSAYFPDTSDAGNYSYIKYLHDNGYIVLFVPIFSFADLEGEYGESEESGSTGYHPIFSKLDDRGLYDIRFIVLGKYSTAEGSYNAARCAAKRGDAIALIDIPEIDDQGQTLAYPKTAQEIHEYFNTAFASKPATIIKSYVDGDPVTESIFKYAAAFAPKVMTTTKVESTTKEEYEALPTIAYLLAFNRQLTNPSNNFPEWFATAGAVRGQIPLANLKTKLNFGDYDNNKYLTPRNGNNRSCNAICEVKPYGKIIYGNRTLYKTFDEGKSTSETTESDLTASNFLNIRQICCTLKKTIYRACRKFTFEPNSDVLWVNFCEEIRPILEKMKTSQGIRGYSFEKVPTSKKALLRAKIIISPIEAVEDFDVTVELADEVTVTE